MSFTEWWKKQAYKFNYWLDCDLKFEFPDYQAEKETKAIALAAWKAGRRELKKAGDDE